MELIVIAILFGGGWLAGRFVRWSDQHILAILLAVGVTGMAVRHGIYLQWFKPTYADESAPMGLTPNALAGFALYLGAFLAGSIARQQKTALPATTTAQTDITVRIEVNRRSSFITVDIVNERDIGALVTFVVLAGAYDASALPIEWTSIGEVSGKRITLNHYLKPEESLSFQVKGESLPLQLNAAWVHGFDAASLVAWHRKAVLVTKG